MPPPHFPLISVTEQHRALSSGDKAKGSTYKAFWHWREETSGSKWGFPPAAIREHHSPTSQNTLFGPSVKAKRNLCWLPNSWKPHWKHPPSTKNWNSRDYTRAYQEYSQWTQCRQAKYLLCSAVFYQLITQKSHTWGKHNLSMQAGALCQLKRLTSMGRQWFPLGMGTPQHTSLCLVPATLHMKENNNNSSPEIRFTIRRHGGRLDFRRRGWIEGVSREVKNCQGCHQGGTDGTDRARLQSKGHYRGFLIPRSGFSFTTPQKTKVTCLLKLWRKNITLELEANRW